MQKVVETAILGVIAIAQVGILVWYYRKGKLKNKKEQERRQELAKEYPYEALRTMALSVVPGAILANVPEGELFVYSVLMDWHMGDDLITLVAQITGEANLYVKSGGGIIGAGKHVRVSEAAQAFVRLSADFLQFAFPATATALPDKNNLRFFLLTNKGKYVINEEMKNIEAKTSNIFPLFERASNVIAEMRGSAGA
ncbi:MAG: hypothetical protein H7257_14930 [Taibaiella sp.]|nr:hypothetical protein [Taibaiella sp.]